MDTAAFIYLVEEHAEYLPVVEPLFREVAGGRRQAVTSAITLLEVLVVPYRTGDLELVRRYEAILTRSRGVRIVEVDRGQIHSAALLRARYGIRTPDALQVAAVLSAGCETFVTNDRDLPAVPGIRILQLRSYLVA